MTESKKITDSARFLLDNGLLFEINRTILHPFGLALEIGVEEKDGKVRVFFGKIWDERKDPEGILYTDDSYKIGHDKFKKFMAEFGEGKLKLRKETTGFIVQEMLFAEEKEE